MKDLLKVLLKEIHEEHQSSKELSLILWRIFESAVEFDSLRFFMDFCEENDFNTGVHISTIRLHLYKCLELSLSGCIKGHVEFFCSNREEILQFITVQTEGEKDVRNFQSLMNIWSVLLPNLGKSVLDRNRARIFDNLQIYFPITNKTLSDKLLIDNLTLIRELVSLLSSYFAAEFSRLIIDKLRVKDVDELTSLRISL